MSLLFCTKVSIKQYIKDCQFAASAQGKLLSTFAAAEILGFRKILAWAQLL